MLTAAVFSLLLTPQAATGQVAWGAPVAPPAAAPPPAQGFSLPEQARRDPFGYERAQCHPLIRPTDEPLETCQTRVRVALYADLGDSLPAALRPTGAPDTCRREAAGDRYAVQCGAPSRPDRPALAMEERVCETRPQAREQGGVVWTEDCRTASPRRADDRRLSLRFGDRD